MQLNILDRKPGWLLCKVSLLDYIKSLKEDNFNYDIQRGIVPNSFLDTILDAIVDKNPLPPISLVVREEDGGSDFFTIEKFNILDGLQRTYRLWIYYKLAELAKQKQSNNYRDVTTAFRERCDRYSVAVTPRQVRSLFNEESKINVWNLEKYYENFDLYLYVWTGLSFEQEVKQMIILNAGQKPMNLNNQLELIYMRLFDQTDFDHGNIQLIRSKDWNAKKRRVGMYPMSSVIIGIQSLINAKPIRLSREMIYNDSDLCIDTSIPSLDSLFTQSYVTRFLDLFYELDNKLSVTEESSEWFVKDTTISGIMAGIGRVKSIPSMSPDETLSSMRECVAKITGIQDFALDDYRQAYEALSSLKINIGMVVRRAVMNYTIALIRGEKNSWKQSFDDIMK